ncbi:MAG TPA: EAL domain-containing protein, partial [Acidimicrobiales bacterium]
VGEALLGTARRRDVASLAAGQARVFELIARGAPLAETLEAVARLLEDNDDPVAAAALVVVDEGTSLAVAAAPSLDDDKQRMLDGLTIGPSSPAGLAVAEGEVVRVDDLAIDSRFPEARATVSRLGARSVLAVPVEAPRSGTTVAVLLVLGYETGVADRVDPGRLESCASLVAVAVERANEEARLAYQATHDALTRVANRATLLDRLTIALARAKRTGHNVAVLFCDLDRFKAINDQFGHDRGDQLLVEVAEKIGRALRPSDTVSRLGGDEFVVLCDDLVDPGQAMLVAERVSRAVESVVVRIDGDELGVTASIGVAVSNDEIENPEELLRDADMAMYRAKAQGRARRELFSAEPGDDPMPTELLDAMAAGELRLDLQPMVGFDGVLVGIEALVRWDDPARGPLLPDRILAAAERGGVVTDLGRWVLMTALAQHVDWQVVDHRFAAVPVHINLTTRDLAAPGFSEQVADALRESGSEPGALVVEVSEGSISGLAGSDVFAQLQDLGVKVVVDGFGLGGGPLLALPGLRVHGIKLDRALVGALDHDPGAVEVASALVGLAHGLALRALAVGVENDEQLDRLRDLGLDSLQGDLVSPPVRSDDGLGGLRDLLSDDG